MIAGTFIVSISGAILALALSEFIVRRLRFADYIRYRRSTDVGYFPRPNSSGLMRGRYRWRINAMGLRADFDEPIRTDAVVLVGDSIVEGGAFVDQADTIGCQIEKQINRRVYPVGAGGWTLGNELAFLNKNPSLLETRTCVIVTNSDDLGDLNRWSTENTHPTKIPWSHMLFLIGRLCWNFWYRVRGVLWIPQVERSSGGDAKPHWRMSVSTLLGRYEGRLIWVLYPDRTELKRGAEPCAQLRQLASQAAEIIELTKERDWTEGCYLDRLHPNAIGRKVLANVIASAVLGSRQFDS